MIPIVFAVDNGYVKQLATVVVSILKNSSQENCFEFNIMSKDITDENKKLISSLKKYNNNSVFNFIDMNSYIKDINLEKYMSRRKDYTYISIETYFRFFIPEIFPQHNKVLYLDADILVMDDIKKLYDHDVENNYAGVIRDFIISKFVHDLDTKVDAFPNMNYVEYFQNKLKKLTLDYFNAGVLLLNLDEIRKDNITEKLWKFAIDESPLQYQDQDVLNAVFDTKVKFVDYKWNMLKDKGFVDSYHDKKTKKILQAAYAKPSIFHYVGADKPWCCLDDKCYSYAHIKPWWQYYQLTPYFKRNELFILKQLLWKHKNWGCRSYISIRVLDFVLLDICEDKGVLNIKILNFLKTRIKYKSPKFCTQIKSI